MAENGLQQTRTRLNSCPVQSIFERRTGRESGVSEESANGGEVRLRKIRVGVRV